MDIQHCFNIYQEQLDTIRRSGYYGRPQILRQFRMQFKGFSNADVRTLISFLEDNTTKWFAANLLEQLDSFPVELLEPMLVAAVNEPDPSFNNEFIKPCRRVFGYVAIQTILLNIFRTGDKEKKIGVLRALYWARPTVYVLTVHEGEKVYQLEGHETFFWDYELKEFNDDFKEDKEVFAKEHPRQEAMYTEQVKTILTAFYETTDSELKYMIALRLPVELKDYPEELQAEGKIFLRNKEMQGIPENIVELNKVKHIKSSFLRRLLLDISRLFSNRGFTILVALFCLIIIGCAQPETIIIDGVVQSREQLQELETSEIFSHSTWPPGEAPPWYHKWNKTRLTVVKTKKRETELQKKRHALLNLFLDSLNRGADILFVQDGMLVFPEARKDLRLLTPAQLSNVDTMERNAARKLFGSVAKPITVIINGYTE